MERQWLEYGLRRQRKGLLKSVRWYRIKEERIEFLNALKEIYMENANDTSYARQNKRKRMDGNSENGNGKKSKVKVVNFFELIEL